MSARPVGRWTVWALTSGAITFGTFAADVALTGMIDGAATRAEATLLWRTAVLAVVSLASGVAGYLRLVRSPTTDRWHERRRRLALTTAVVAAVIGAVRISILGGRLVRHVRLDRDEPLTTVSLALQVTVAVAGYGLLLTFALRDVLKTRRATSAVPRPAPTPTDVGRTGCCPAN